MPRAITSRTVYPDGWEKIEPAIMEFEQRMRDGLLSLFFFFFLSFVLPITAEAEPHEGKRKMEAQWPIFRIHHERSRYVLFSLLFCIYIHILFSFCFI